MKKKDGIAIVGILLAALLIFIVGKMFSNGHGGGEAVILAEGKEYGRYSLSKEQKIDIAGSNILMIQNGKADMIEADCPDKLCVHQKAIDKKGETIVCLPNKIVIEIDGQAEYNEIDAVVN